MDLLTYQGKAARTATHANVMRERQLIAAVGLIGEAAEFGEIMQFMVGEPICTWGGLGAVLNLDKVVKELGDCWWYTAELHTCFGLSLDVDADIPPELDPVLDHLREQAGWEVGVMLPLYMATKLSVTFSRVTEYVKKVVGHNHPLDLVELHGRLTQAKRVLELMADYAGLDSGDIRAANIVKLEKRFPDKFSTEASLARVDVR